MRNRAVSLLHLPPTSAARTTRRAATFTGELWVGCFLPASRHLQHSTIVISCPWLDRTVPPERRHHCRVDCDLGSSPQCQTVRHDQACVVCVKSCKVHVAHEHVLLHSSACLPATCAAAHGTHASAVRQGEKKIQSGTRKQLSARCP